MPPPSSRLQSEGRNCLTAPAARLVRPREVTVPGNPLSESASPESHSAASQFDLFLTGTQKKPSNRLSNRLTADPALCAPVVFPEVALFPAPALSFHCVRIGCASKNEVNSAPRGVPGPH